jgi:hypothetical protein
MNENLIGYVVIFFVFFIIIKMYTESDTFNLKCIVSTVDGNKYCVRERKNMQKAADLLAITTKKLKQLSDVLIVKYEGQEIGENLRKNFNPNKIKEILPTSQYTAYSENKGSKIAFCLSDESKDDTKNLIDENTLMFVALHEFTHVATTSIGHGDEFWSNFKTILIEANELGIYTPVDYKNKETEYCGMTINDNPYYDFETSE